MENAKGVVEVRIPLSTWFIIGIPMDAPTNMTKAIENRLTTLRNNPYQLELIRNEVRDIPSLLKQYYEFAKDSNNVESLRGLAVKVIAFAFPYSPYLDELSEDTGSVIPAEILAGISEHCIAAGYENTIAYERVPELLKGLSNTWVQGSVQHFIEDLTEQLTRVSEEKANDIQRTIGALMKAKDFQQEYFRHGDEPS